METFSDIKLASYSIKKEYYPEKVYVKCPDCPKLLHCSFCVQFLRRQNPHHWVGIKINEIPGCLGCEERYMRGLSETRTEVMWLRKKMGLLEMKIARQAEDIREALDLADGRALAHPLALAFDDESTESAKEMNMKEMNVKQKTPFAIGNLDLGLGMGLGLGLDLDLELDFRRAREQEEERRAAEMMMLKSDMEKLRDSFEILRSKMTFLKRRAPAGVASAAAVCGANVCRCGGGSTSPERGDVTFVVEGREIHGHQLILAFESRVFRELFNSADTVEARICRCTCSTPMDKRNTLSARQIIFMLPQPSDEPEPQQQSLSHSGESDAKQTDSQGSTLESKSVLEAQSSQSSSHPEELESGTTKDVDSLQSSTPLSASPPSPPPVPPDLANEDVALRGQSSETFPWVNVRLIPSRMLEQMGLRGVRCNLIVPEEELTLSTLEALEAERREKRAAGSPSEPSDKAKLESSEKRISLSEPAVAANDGEGPPPTPIQDDGAAPANLQPIPDSCEDEKVASGKISASSSDRKSSAAPHDIGQASEDVHPESKEEFPGPSPSPQSINAPEIPPRQEENPSVSNGTRGCACSNCGCTCGKEALRINTDGTSFGVMEAVINCCYTAEIHFTEAVQPEEVLQCAHKYEMEYVRDLCDKELCKRLNAENLPEMLKLGRNFEARKLYLEATKFFRDNFDTVHENFFQNFC